MAPFKNANELAQYAKKIQAERPADRRAVAICAGTGCKAFGAFALVDIFKEELTKAGLADKVELRPTGCHGFCERGPLVLLFPEGMLYQRVKPEDVPEIVEKTLERGEVIERLLYEEPGTGRRFAKEEDIPFYKHQHRLVLRSNGLIDPTSIDDYFSLGGYQALSKAFEMGPDKALAEVKQANLRGRGGGGFPAGVKWELARRTESDKKYIICNADEGDPGAFMDRSIIEGNPHAVIEGMLIGGFVMGADEAYVYVRQEYPLAVERLQKALRDAESYGLLGEDILGSGYSLKVNINRGGGAFVCGEESALIASIEGQRGVPRKRPPYPVERGLWGKPTNINNVETWANVPLIIDRGAAWFSSIGTERSKGTKIFSLVGKVNNTGLVEIPMGMTLKEIVFDIGGGIPAGKKFKAVQTGGPSGGCLPEEKLDLAVDFDTLTQEGAMMGSGGMIVMDEDTCMVDVAKYFLGFLRHESCGNCTSCRDGLAWLHSLLVEISEGRGSETTVELVEQVADTVRASSLCALGKTAVNPVLSTLKYFRDEYLAHVKEHKCPAKICKELITFVIDEKACTGCLLCKKRCPQDAVLGEKKKPHQIVQEKCIKCGICKDVCKDDAVMIA